MIKIISKSKVKEGCEAEYERIAAELVEKSSAEEGCISYTNNRCLEDPSVYSFIEIWEDEAAIERHNNSAHFKELVPKLGELREAAAAIEHFKELGD